MRISKADVLIPAALLLLALAPSIAGLVRMTQLVGGAQITPDNARFFAAPIPVLIHIPSAVVYSLLGAFMFSPGFRRRHRRLHRAAGRLLLPAGLLVALSGLWMAHFYPWPAGDGIAVYIERLVFGSFMVFSLGRGLGAIRRRDFVSHGNWMIRAYAIGMGAGTQVVTHLPWFVLVDHAPGELARGVLMGSAWVINMVVAEWIIRRSPAREAARPMPDRPMVGTRPAVLPAQWKPVRTARVTAHHTLEAAPE